MFVRAALDRNTEYDPAMGNIIVETYKSLRQGLAILGVRRINN
jgi:hypothetical protein